MRSAVFAAMLACEGFTASSEPFEGTYGLQHVLGPIEPTLPVLPDGPRVVQMDRLIRMIDPLHDLPGSRRGPPRDDGR